MFDEIKKNIKGIALMFLSATSLCVGQLIWKKMDGVQIIPLLLGFVVYGIGALVMIMAFRYGELSVLQPMNSMSYVISTILGYFVLKENITMKRLIGIIIIVIGVFILASAGNENSSENDHKDTKNIKNTLNQAGSEFVKSDAGEGGKM